MDSDSPFYVLVGGDPDLDNAVTDFIPGVKSEYGPAPQCPTCNRYIALGQWQPPFRVEMEFWGAIHGDIAFFGGSILVSERFQSVYQRANLTGLDFLPQAEIIRVLPRRMKTGCPTYFPTRIANSNTTFDDIASGVIAKSRWECASCRIYDAFDGYRRIVLIPNTWGGEDIFIARGLPGVIITTSRFRQICLDSDIRNAVFIPCQDYSPSWMHDDDRAEPIE